MQLYIHVPFCKSKCRYCDFNSYACHDKQAIFEYLNVLDDEIRLASEQYGKEKTDTIYVGGGTPSLIEGSLMWSLLNNLACRFDLSHLKEWTIECNPESINEQKLELYKDVGINRISIGVQSLFDDNLKAIGRLHDAKTAIEKIKLARRYFDNVRRPYNRTAVRHERANKSRSRNACAACETLVDVRIERRRGHCA